MTHKGRRGGAAGPPASSTSNGSGSSCGSGSHSSCSRGSHTHTLPAPWLSSSEALDLFSRGNVSQLKRLVRSGLDPNQPVQCSVLDAEARLVEDRGQVYAPDTMWPLLFVACRKGNSSIVAMLCAAGAAVDTQHVPSGWTALLALLHNDEISCQDKLAAIKVLDKHGFRGYGAAAMSPMFRSAVPVLIFCDRRALQDEQDEALRAELLAHLVSQGAASARPPALPADSQSPSPGTPPAWDGSTLSDIAHALVRCASPRHAALYLQLLQQPDVMPRYGGAWGFMFACLLHCAAQEVELAVGTASGLPQQALGRPLRRSTSSSSGGGAGGPPAAQSGPFQQPVVALVEAALHMGGVDMNKPLPGGLLPIEQLALPGRAPHPDLLEVALRCGMDPNLPLRFSQSRPPRFCAMCSGIDGPQPMLWEGADGSGSGDQDVSACAVACCCCDPSPAYSFLLHWYASRTATLQQEQETCITALQLLLDSGANPFARGWLGEVPGLLPVEVARQAGNSTAHNMLCMAMMRGGNLAARAAASAPPGAPLDTTGITLARVFVDLAAWLKRRAAAAAVATAEAAATGTSPPRPAADADASPDAGWLELLPCFDSRQVFMLLDLLDVPAQGVSLAMMHCLKGVALEHGGVACPLPKACRERLLGRLGRAAPSFWEPYLVHLFPQLHEAVMENLVAGTANCPWVALADLLHLRRTCVALGNAQLAAQPYDCGEPPVHGPDAELWAEMVRPACSWAQMLLRYLGGAREEACSPDQWEALVREHVLPSMGDMLQCEYHANLLAVLRLGCCNSHLELQATALRELVLLAANCWPICRALAELLLDPSDPEQRTWLLNSFRLAAGQLPAMVAAADACEDAAVMCPCAFEFAQPKQKRHAQQEAAAAAAAAAEAAGVSAEAVSDIVSCVAAAARAAGRNSFATPLKQAAALGVGQTPGGAPAAAGAGAATPGTGGTASTSASPAKALRLLFLPLAHQKTVEGALWALLLAVVAQGCVAQAVFEEQARLRHTAGRVPRTSQGRGDSSGGRHATSRRVSEVSGYTSGAPSPHGASRLGRCQRNSSGSGWAGSSTRSSYSGNSGGRGRRVSGASSSTFCSPAPVSPGGGSGGPAERDHETTQARVARQLFEANCSRYVPSSDGHSGASAGAGAPQQPHHDAHSAGVTSSFNSPSSRMGPRDPLQLRPRRGSCGGTSSTFSSSTAASGSSGLSLASVASCDHDAVLLRLNPSLVLHHMMPGQEYTTPFPEPQPPPAPPPPLPPLPPLGPSASRRLRSSVDDMSSQSSGSSPDGRPMSAPSPPSASTGNTMQPGQWHGQGASPLQQAAASAGSSPAAWTWGRDGHCLGLSQPAPAVSDTATLLVRRMVVSEVWPIVQTVATLSEELDPDFVKEGQMFLGLAGQHPWSLCQRAADLAWDAVSGVEELGFSEAGSSGDEDEQLAATRVRVHEEHGRPHIPAPAPALAEANVPCSSGSPTQPPSSPGVQLPCILCTSSSNASSPVATMLASLASPNTEAAAGAPAVLEPSPCTTSGPATSAPQTLSPSASRLVRCFGHQLRLQQVGEEGDGKDVDAPRQRTDSTTPRSPATGGMAASPKAWDAATTPGARGAEPPAGERAASGAGGGSSLLGSASSMVLGLVLERGDDAQQDVEVPADQGA